MERLLDHMLGHSGVWQATGIEIAEWYNAQGLAEYERHLDSGPPVPAAPRAERR